MNPAPRSDDSGLRSVGDGRFQQKRRLRGSSARHPSTGAPAANKDSRNGGEAEQVKGGEKRGHLAGGMPEGQISPSV
jgi:hypothetical protein